MSVPMMIEEVYFTIFRDRHSDIFELQKKLAALGGIK
jgi:hypothetical protein